MAIKKANIFSITSVKGGTGKTTTTLNLAGIFSTLKKKVLIMDLDLYSGAIAPSLNIDNEKDLYKLVYDLNNNQFHMIDDYIVSYNEWIDVIPAPKDPRFANKINSKYLGIVLSKAQTKYDVILIDTNHFMNELNLMAFDYSDEIIYIITNDPIDLKNMKTMVSIYKDMELQNYKIVLNESSDRLRDYFSKYDIKNIIKDNIDYTIPTSFYIKTIDKYVLDGTILTLNSKIRSTHKKAIQNLEKMATSLLKEKEQ